MNNIKTILTSGAFVNFVLVLIGASLGVLLKKGIPEKLKNAIMTGMALCVLLIGINGMLDPANDILVIIISVALGAVIGELFDLDGAVNKIGKTIENSINRGGRSGNLAEGFVTATLLFCVGAMTIVGSINSGISADNSTLYYKSVIDCMAAIPLASTFGIGVALAAIPVLIIEGGITLLAVLISPILNQDIIVQMSSIGSLLIVSLSLNMMGIKKIKVMNYLPAIFIPIILCRFI